MDSKTPILLFLVILTSCSTAPPQVQDSTLPGFKEIRAAPSLVSQVCALDRSERLDEGGRAAWNQYYCGCVICSKFDGLKCLAGAIWTARSMDCPPVKTLAHERCHAETDFSEEARRECHRRFPPDQPRDPWVRLMGR